EYDQMQAFRALLDPSSVLFDIGANMGLYALAAAKAGATVYAFEPSIVMQEMLRTNIAINHFEEAIQVIPDAVSDTAAQATFVEGRAGNQGVGKLFEFCAATHDARRYEVNTNSLDAFAELLT